MKKNKKLSVSHFMFCVLAMVLGMANVPVAYCQNMLPEDVNNDGAINILDALLVARYSAGISLNGFYVQVANANCDGLVNILDALLIAKHAAGLALETNCVAVPSATPLPTPAFIINPTGSPSLISVKGYLTGMYSQEPIAGIPLTLTLLDTNSTVITTTDADGFYNLTTFSGNITEQAILQAGKAGFEPFLLQTTLPCGKTTTIAIRLLTATPTPTSTPNPTPTPSPTCLASSIITEGYVLDNLTALPIAGASVSLQTVSGTGSASTNANGYYRLSGIPACSTLELSSIVVNAPGYPILEVVKSLASGSTQVLHFSLARIVAEPVLPTPQPVGPLEILSFCYMQSDTGNPTPFFSIKNTGNSVLDLSRVSFRYWFTADGAEIVYSHRGNNTAYRDDMLGLLYNVSGAVKADMCLEIRLRSSVNYTLEPGATTAMIQYHLSKTPAIPSFYQLNDYSFFVSSTGFKADPRITGYIDGVLVFGTEPFPVK